MSGQERPPSQRFAAAWANALIVALGTSPLPVPRDAFAILVLCKKAWIFDTRTNP